MKQRIYQNFCLIALVSLFCSTIASLSLYMSFHNQSKQQDLKDHCRNMVIAIEEINKLGGDVLDFLQASASDSIRITLIQPDGTVLWDSMLPPAELDNHKNRPEIQEVLSDGSGEEVRRSDSTGLDSYYCALPLSDGKTILRLARNQTNVYTTFQQIMPLDLISCLVLFFVCAFFSDTATNHIVQPMLEAAKDSENLNPDDFYEELAPFLQTIRQQNDTIRAQLAAIQRDKDTITFIYQNMKEGLVMVSHDFRVLTVNKSAMSMLDCYLKEPEGQSFSSLTQNIALNQAVEVALNGDSDTDLLPADHNGRIYRYFANPVYTSTAETDTVGMLLLLLDVTEQQRAQRAREEFSANISHELKTPLTSISGFAELIESGMASSPEDIHQFSALIRKESARLLTLIDDIIHLSRIEVGYDELQETVDLTALAMEEREHLLAAAAKKQVEIRCEGEIALIRGNRTMLQEAVYNLCENAVKYNKNGGFVHISIEHSPNEVVLRVADSGIGIAKEHHERVFERFYRVDKSRSKETGGTGLGLSIVKHVVQLHNGRLSIESEPGKGTCIELHFPTLAASTPPLPPLSENPEK